VYDIDLASIVKKQRVMIIHASRYNEAHEELQNSSLCSMNTNL
jgi:hypothetical protein